jgi:hypothetical protein
MITGVYKNYITGLSAGIIFHRKKQLLKAQLLPGEQKYRSALLAIC